MVTELSMHACHLGGGTTDWERGWRSGKEDEGGSRVLEMFIYIYD